MHRNSLWAALVLCGCAATPPPSVGQRFDITIEAVADKDARTPRQVIIAPEGEADAEFAYGALFAAGLLGSNGYKITGDLAKADLVVVVDLGVSEPTAVIWEPPPGQRTAARRDELFARHLTLT